MSDSIAEVNSIFQQPWWLDAVAPGQWDAVEIKKNGKIVARMPYVIKKRFGMTCITMPPLTQTLGPWLAPCNSDKEYKKLSYEKDLMTSLIENLPKYDYFSQNFHSDITNWLPFYWNGFKQTTRYSYVISNISDIEEVVAQWSHAKRKNIKKAINTVNVDYDMTPVEFYEHHKYSLSQLGSKISYSLDLFLRIHNATTERHSGKIIAARDKRGNIHSALFVIWDHRRAYDLISTIDPRFRNSDATTLLEKEIIAYLSDKTEIFDFEGSMIEGVENSFRQLGTQQIPYFQVKKASTRMQIALGARSMLRMLAGKR